MDLKKVFKVGGLILLLVLLALLVMFILHLVLPRNYKGLGEVLPLKLSSGDFQVLYYCADASPRGIVLVATGDGGWSNQWEEPLAMHLMQSGYAIAGWDCRKFADSRAFDREALQESMEAAVEQVRRRASLPKKCPVWYTGWSTGAEWILAAAASPHLRHRVVGLLPAAPGRRSRFGITANDLLGLVPEGEKSFALMDMARDLHGMAIAQFSAGLDPTDDSDWHQALPSDTRARLVTIPGVLHDMNGAGEAFCRAFDESMAWTLQQSEMQHH